MDEIHFEEARLQMALFLFIFLQSTGEGMSDLRWSSGKRMCCGVFRERGEKC